MSFHPLMVYDPKRFQQSERRLVEEGAPFTFTPERRAALDELLTKYPPDRKGIDQIPHLAEKIIPELRAVAGLGAELVRTNQESLLASAWAQGPASSRDASPSSASTRARGPLSTRRTPAIRSSRPTTATGIKTR